MCKVLFVSLEIIATVIDKLFDNAIIKQLKSQSKLYLSLSLLDLSCNKVASKLI